MVQSLQLCIIHGLDSSNSGVFSADRMMLVYSVLILFIYSIVHSYSTVKPTIRVSTLNDEIDESSSQQSGKVERQRTWGVGVYKSLRW